MAASPRLLLDLTKVLAFQGWEALLSVYVVSLKEMLLHLVWFQVKRGGNVSVIFGLETSWWKVNGGMIWITGWGYRQKSEVSCVCLYGDFLQSIMVNHHFSPFFLGLFYIFPTTLRSKSKVHEIPRFMWKKSMASNGWRRVFCWLFSMERDMWVHWFCLEIVFVSH